MRRDALALTVLLALAADRPAAKPADQAPRPEGFQPLFNGKDLAGWKVYGGKMDAWGAEGGLLFVNGGGGGWLMTEKEYGDFELRLEFRLPKAGNSGVALRAPPEGNPAHAGMEVQLLDDPWYKDPKNYKGLRDETLCGSIWGVVPPFRDATRPAGEWNTLHVTARGRRVTVELNGATTVDADLNYFKDRVGARHPGLTRASGSLGLQGDPGRRVEFRNIYVKPL
jgi:3-keto-disaccharide hydrolase